MLVWQPSTDNTAVVGYDVYLGERRTRVKGPASGLGGLCGQALNIRIVALDRAANRSRALKASIQTPACLPRPPANWSSGFETEDTSEWDFIHSFAPERFAVVASDGAVTPRKGAYLARVEVRHNEPASWSAGANVALASKSTVPGGLGELGADAYVGFSLFLPKGFAYVPNNFFNNIFEWHGDTSAVQASIHLFVDGFIGKHYGISNPTAGFVLDLHTENGYRPAMFRFGDLVTGRWVDFVIRTKWATDSSGIVEGWMDGVKKFSTSRKTWYSEGQIRSVYPELGYYRANYARTAVLYVDAFRVGSSYGAVAP